MSFRNRIRKWLGIEADVVAHMTDLLAVQERCRLLRADVDNLTFNAISSADKIKEIRSSVGSCSADSLAMFESAKKDYARVAESLRQFRSEYEAYRTTFFQRMDAAEKAIKATAEQGKSDIQNLGDAAREIWAKQDARIGRLCGVVDEATKEGIARYGDVGAVMALNADNLKGIDERLTVIETASRSLGGHLALIANNAAVAQRERAISAINNYHSSGFRPAHREALIKKLREEV